MGRINVVQDDIDVLPPYLIPSCRLIMDFIRVSAYMPHRQGW